MRKSILVVSQEPISNPNTGGKRSIFYRWSALAEYFDICFVCLNLDGTGVRVESTFAGFKDYKEYPRDSATLRGGGVRSLLELLKTVRAGVPRGAVVASDLRIMDWVAQNGKNFDHIVCENIYSAHYLLKLKRPFSVVAHNDEFRLSLELCRLSNGLERAFYVLDAIKMWFYQRRVFRKATRVFFIANEEHEQFSLANPKKFVHLGQHCSESQTSWRFNSRRKVLFNSNLAYEPNVEGLRFFKTYIHPLVLNAHADYELVITGGAPVQVVNQDWPSNFKFLGFLSEEDFQAVTGECDVMINPVRAGAGVKIKVLDALTEGLPIVSFPQGINEDFAAFINIASDVVDFANFCKSLLREEPSECGFTAASYNAKITSRFINAL